MSFEAWTEWKQLCAYSRCARDSREALGRMLQASFGKALHKLFCVTGIPPELDRMLKETDEARDYIWKVFEEHFTGASGTHRHLSRKDVMFADILDDSEVRNAKDVASAEELASRKLTAYARNSMRDVVLKYAQKAYSYQQRAKESSWEEITQGGLIEGFVMGINEVNQFLPPVVDPLDEPWFKETSEAVAAKVYQGATPRQRVAFWAKIEGISLADEAVQAAAGCGHAQVYVAFDDVVASLTAETARQVGGNEVPEVAAEIRRLAYYELAELVRNDYSSGKTTAS